MHSLSVCTDALPTHLLSERQEFKSQLKWLAALKQFQDNFERRSPQDASYAKRWQYKRD